MRSKGTSGVRPMCCRMPGRSRRGGIDSTSGRLTAPRSSVATSGVRWDEFTRSAYRGSRPRARPQRSLEPAGRVEASSSTARLGARSLTFRSQHAEPPLPNTPRPRRCEAAGWRLRLHPRVATCARPQRPPARSDRRVRLGGQLLMLRRPRTETCRVKLGSTRNSTRSPSGAPDSVTKLCWSRPTVRRGERACRREVTTDHLRWPSAQRGSPARPARSGPWGRARARARNIG